MGYPIGKEYGAIAEYPLYTCRSAQWYLNSGEGLRWLRLRARDDLRSCICTTWLSPFTLRCMLKASKQANKHTKQKTNLPGNNFETNLHHEYGVICVPPNEVNHTKTALPLRWGVVQVVQLSTCSNDYWARVFFAKLSTSIVNLQSKQTSFWTRW